mmetsp:Transcript_84226/g.272228  ORF Transcript_84226/g.272228 Transcript_84226/m.272228 type:complete len:354 (+) Transcript_84226:951-2012(+)
MPELAVLTKLDLQRHRAHARSLGVGLGHDQREGLEVLADQGFLYLQGRPKALGMRALCRVHDLEQLLQGLLLVGDVELGRQEAAQCRGCASSNVALCLQEHLLRICQVNANRQHLRPCLSATFSLLHHGRDAGELLVRRLRLVLHHRIRLLGDLDQPERSMRDASHEVLVVVLENTRRDDAEATRDQRIASLLPVRHDGLLHGPTRSECFQGILPELLRLHERCLHRVEQIPLAMSTEDEHGDEALLLVPCLVVVHGLDQEELMHAEHSVVRHPALRETQVRRDEGLDAGPHLLRLTRQRQLSARVLLEFHFELALTEVKELIDGGRRQRLASAWRILAGLACRNRPSIRALF